MGCIQAKGTVCSPTNGLGKLKLDNGYVQGRDAKKQDHNKASRPKVDVKNEVVAAGGGGRERKISREGERGINGGGNVSQRISVKKLAVDELVGGWPKWLVDHVPSDVLAGFIPTTADSYDKLAKAKGTVCSPTNGLGKLKLDNGYVQGRDAKKQDHNKASRPKVDVKNEVVAAGGGGRERKISREGERGINGGGNVSQRISVKKLAVDELVGGWPKWLVDHVPSDVLAGFIPTTADSYDKLAKVGHGTYSNVYKARHKFTGKLVALKKVRFDKSEPESVKFMAREIIMLKHLDHPNIIKLEGIATSRMQYSLYLVFDFMPSDLTKVISRSEGRLTAPQVKCYMQQLLSGLQHCHEREILHRDIKGSNLLIDRNGMLKIADFGLANFYKNKTKPTLTSRVVTLWYRAPELLLGSTDYGVGIDLWSAGCLLAEMFEGRPIMPGRNEVIPSSSTCAATS
ncbi:unnamed protein product [Fraxinus pennsylvanica]|uniref:Protein kinase domain-containing protein n=1 Tax=Fraxinus pennsylvanica TaxID=56036 RepID=A0AAD1YY83_9LAMI|nr:unnamed protein product [Fraxinus pennsylvanica]